MNATSHKKRVPSTSEEKTFIQDARNILAGTIQDHSQIGVNGEHGKILKELLPAYREDGSQGYWTVYEAIARDRPYLADWRAQIKSPQAEPGLEQPPAYEYGKYKPVTLLELAKRPRPKDIIDGIFYEQIVGELFGTAGTKKSFLAFDWMAHIAMNMHWQGRAIKKPGKCVYTVAEGVVNFIKRAFAWCSYHDVPLEKLSENLILVDREIPLSNASETAEFIADIGEFIHRVAPVSVVFDTLMRCSGGENINAPDVMARLFDGANKIRRELDASHALIIHHEGKDSTKGSAGSFVMRANCDIAHHLACEPSTGILTLSCRAEVGGKMKDKAEYPDMYLNTKSVHYTDPYMEAIPIEDSSLVIIGGEKPPQKITLNPNRQAMYDALPEGNGLRFSEWKQAVDKARSADELGDIKKQTFIDNINWLIKTGLVRKVGTEVGTEAGTDHNTYWRTTSSEGGEE